MGYAFGENNNGREIGYGVKGVCDLPGCDEEIDHGLYHCCGGIDGVENAGMEDEPYCGDFFCGTHLIFGAWNMVDDVHPGHVHDAICPPCMDRWIKKYGPEEQYLDD